MERREQRVRRDRKKDGRRNPAQKDEDRETVTKSINQKSTPTDTKGNNQKNEVTAGKSAIKDKVEEDDPLRFANLKRETDEIAALKAKKPQKRQVFSNWWRYEEPVPITNESQAVDFETLLHAPQSGNFRFKSEAQWDAGSFGQFGELFMPDAELLVAGLTSIPFYTRLGVDKHLLLEDEIKKMDSSAKANSVAYEKVNKSKQKPKRDVMELFKLNYSDEYSVVDKENVPPSEARQDIFTGKPQFVVEQSPEPAVTFVKPSTGITPYNVQPAVPSREGTPTKECEVDMASQTLHFGKPTPPSSSVASVNHTPLLSRESTPAKDGTEEAARAFDFGRPPPQPQVSTSNLQRMPPNRESTPAKQTVSQSVSGELSFRSETPPPTPCSERSVGDSGQELQVIRSQPTTSEHTSETVQPLQNGVPSEEAASSQKDPTFVSVSKTVPLDEIPSEEVVQTIDSASIEQQAEKLTNPPDGNLISEQKPSRDDIAVLENYPKKVGKVENRKDSSQKGGGKHSRKKKGQQSSTREHEQTEVMTDRNAESVRLENRSYETEKLGTPKAELSTVQDKPEVKKKPERPPPPVLQQPSPTPRPDIGPPPVGAIPAASNKQATQAPAKKKPSTTVEKQGVQGDDDHLNFLMSLKGQKATGVSEVEAAKSLKNTAVSRSAIEEDELRESQKPKAPPAITTEKKEDLEDWLDSMLDD